MITEELSEAGPPWPAGEQRPSYLAIDVPGRILSGRAVNDVFVWPYLCGFRTRENKICGGQARRVSLQE
jgi:hypothetical protein